MMDDRYKYNPDYAVAPGATLKDFICDAGLHLVTLEQAIAAFAERSGLPVETVKALLTGQAEITPDIADKLAVTGYSAKLWLALEKNYRDQLAKLRKGGYN
jgi:plasmid maintenance system antidote protein VapI